MGDRNEYAAFSIPPRGEKPVKEAAQPLQSDPLDAALFSGSGFAEIEIDAGLPHASAGEKALRFFSAVTQGEPIKERASDPIRQRFFDMRSLASGKPFARNDAELFYRQAKFMEDYTDDYEGGAKFFMYYPYYQHMGYEQLRTYFTWRTKARLGQILQVPDSYVFLYVYELLSGIGTDDSQDGLNKLLCVWDNFSGQDSAIDNYLPRWIKDYHIYYELPRSFEDFIKEYDLQRHYSLSLIIDTDERDDLELWNNISAYKVTGSGFYKEGNERLLQDCFIAVLGGIRDFCSGREARVEDMLIYRVSNRTPWYPFRQALFFNWLDQPDRKIIMPGQERYFCQDNRWTASLPIYYSTQKEFAGYIIRKTESYLRQVVKYKHKLGAQLKPGHSGFRELKDLDISIDEFDGIIEKAVQKFHRDLTRTVVTVDQINLARIREEAQGTQEKLIVDDDDAFIKRPRDEAVVHLEYAIDAGSAFGEVETEDGETELCSLDELYEADRGNGSESGFPGEVDGWTGLRDSLNATEIQALSILLSDAAGIKAFADANAIMLEVLADSINEKATDCIGDSIIETDGGMVIYDEYRGNVAEMVRGVRS